MFVRFLFRPSVIIFLVVLIIGIVNLIPSENMISLLLALILIASFIGLMVEWIIKKISGSR